MSLIRKSHIIDEIIERPDLIYGFNKEGHFKTSKGSSVRNWIYFLGTANIDVFQNKNSYYLKRVEYVKRRATIML